MRIYNMTFESAPKFLDLKDEAKKVDKNAIITTFEGAVNTYQTRSKKAADAITNVYGCKLEVIDISSGLKNGVM